MNSDFIHIGNFIRTVNEQVPQSPMQTQYLARYLDKCFSTLQPECYPPLLHEGLRIKGNTYMDYHSIEIHKDDLPIFIHRLKQFYKDQS